MKFFQMLVKIVHSYPGLFASDTILNARKHLSKSKSTLVSPEAYANKGEIIF